MRLAQVWRRWPAVAWIYAAIVAVFLASLGQYYQRNTGFTTLICFGDQFDATKLPAVADVPHVVHYKSPGYDGQFYAQLAVEPLLRSPDLYRALDTPPYRARRILFAWTAYLFGLGRPAWIVKAYALQNILAWLLLAWLLLRWFPPSAPRTIVPWIGCLFGIGMATSFRFALLEGPSMVIITLAVLAAERQRSWLAAGLLGLAGLGRETNILASGALVDRIPRSFRDVAILAAKLCLAALPFLLWALYVRSVYPRFSFSNPDSFAVPFSGYLHNWAATFTDLRTYGWHTYARYNVAHMIGITVQAGYLLRRWDWRSPWWRVGIAYVVLGAVLSDPVWGGYPGSYTRVLLPLTFAFNAEVTKSRWFWPLVILGNLSVWHGIPMIGVPWISGLL